MTFNPEAHDLLVIAQDYLYGEPVMTDIETVQDECYADWHIASNGTLVLGVQAGTEAYELAYIEPDGDAWTASLTYSGQCVLRSLDY